MTTLYEIKLDNQRNNQFYFSAETMKFFGSKILDCSYTGIIRESLTYYDGSRIYKLSFYDFEKHDVIQIEMDQNYSYVKRLYERLKYIDISILGNREKNILSNFGYIEKWDSCPKGKQVYKIYDKNEESFFLYDFTFNKVVG